MLSYTLFVVKTIQTCLILVLTAVASPVSAASSTPLDALLNRASAYVCAYVQDFSTVVAEERYLQDAHTVGMQRPAEEHADLRSDLLFVKPDSTGNWLTFRDVFSANGRAVRDREARLAKLFINETPSSVDRAWAIARDGYRYNVGSTDRTVANPMLAMAFLQPAYRDRFDFKLDGIDTSLGADVWIVKFKERARPTILRTPDNRNVPSAGRYWIDGASGRVLQTELETRTADRVMTIFAYDEGLHLDVPVEMRDIAWFNGKVITGTATYTNFRRFDVITDEKFR